MRNNGAKSAGKGLPMKKNKQEIITFKADLSLLEAMKGIPNRSEFIRNAILAWLDSACPICNGTGILRHYQKKHLDNFILDHPLEECSACNELCFICGHIKTGGSKGDIFASRDAEGCDKDTEYEGKAERRSKDESGRD